MEERTVYAGLVGVGLNTYWPQFAGLYDRLCGYRMQIAKRLTHEHVCIVDGGMVDEPEKAITVADELGRQSIDILLVYISTYALSSTVLPLVQRLKVPVLLLNIQPTPCIDYAYLNSLGDRGLMTGEWLANCQACSVPEFSNVFNRSGIRYEIITGYLDEAYVWAELEEWLEAAVTKKGMQNNRMGVLGHYYGGMLDVYSDLTLQSSTFGTHVELLEMCELKAYRDAASSEAIEQKLAEFRERFEVVNECEESELLRAAKTSVALDKLVEAHHLGSMAYYYEGYAVYKAQDL